jgi:hypothetical protein
VIFGGRVLSLAAVVVPLLVVRAVAGQLTGTCAFTVWGPWPYYVGLAVAVMWYVLLVWAVSRGLGGFRTLFVRVRKLGSCAKHGS